MRLSSSSPASPRARCSWTARACTRRPCDIGLPLSCVLYDKHEHDTHEGAHCSLRSHKEIKKASTITLKENRNIISHRARDVVACLAHCRTQRRRIRPRGPR
jgi:hypothetical protein